MRKASSLGKLCRAVQCVEALEGRVMLATVVLDEVNKIATLNGDDNNEAIQLHVSGNRVYFNVNGKDLDKFFDKTYLQIRINASGGNDKITINESWTDPATGVPLRTILDGGRGRDVIVGGAGSDNIMGGEGNDKLFGGAGSDTINYTYRTDSVNVNLKTMQVELSGEQDTISSFENIWSGGGNDRLTGDDGANYLASGSGNDTVSGGDGNDTIVGGTGIDDLNGGLGLDCISYLNHPTPVYVDLSDKAPDGDGDKARGFENIYGGSYDDTLIGTNGPNVIFGRGGADLIYGKGGNDTLNGFVLTAMDPLPDGADTIYGGEGNDALYGLAGDDSLNGGRGADTLTGGDGEDRVDGGAGVDVVSYLYRTLDQWGVKVNLSDPAPDGDGDTLSSIEEIWGSSYNDSLTGAASGTVLRGGGGSDVLVGLGRDDDLHGDGLPDTVADGEDTIVGGAGNDLLHGNDKDDVLNGGLGKDSLYGDLGDDRLLGGAHDDSLYGGGGRDTLEGLNGNDRLFGETGGDNLMGGADNDTLMGGAGADVVDGGAGADTADYSEAGRFAGVKLILNDLFDKGLEEDNVRATVETIIGTVYADTITSMGGVGSDYFIDGRGGDDVLSSQGLDDTLIGGAGRDSFTSGSEGNKGISAPWSERVGGFEAYGGKVQAEETDQESIATVDAWEGGEAVVLTAAVDVPTGAESVNSVGLVARYRDENSYYAGSITNRSAFVIRKGGEDKWVDLPAGMISRGVLRFEVSGKNLKLFLNDVPLISWDDPEEQGLVGGTVGIRAYRPTANEKPATITGFTAGGGESVNQST